MQKREEIERDLRDIRLHREKYPLGVRYKIYKKHVGEMSSSQFAGAIDTLDFERRIYLMKERADTGDKLAGETLQQLIEGDPTAPGEDHRIGLRGMCEKKENIVACEILEKLEEL